MKRFLNVTYTVFSEIKSIMQNKKTTKVLPLCQSAPQSSSHICPFANFNLLPTVFTFLEYDVCVYITRQLQTKH